VPEEKIIADIIGITANRDYSDRAGLYRGLDRLQARGYLFGGARGGDSDALEYIAKTQPGSQRTVVVPNRLGNQPVAAQQTTARYATEVIELKNSGSDRYQIRNRYIVDHSSRMAAFTDGRKSGGTFNTIEYAKTQGRPVQIQQFVTMDKNVILNMNEADFEVWLGQCKEARVPRMAIKSIFSEYMKGTPRSKYGFWIKLLEALCQ
jgi:hypothetical protein